MISLRLNKAPLAGMTLPEITMSTAVVAVMMAALLVGISTLSRSFAASKEHVKSQLEQARVIDYASRDLRRALNVTVDSYQGAARLNIEIPDFYEPVVGGTPKPRQPVIQSSSSVSYGTAPVVVQYYKKTQTDGHTDLIRAVGGVETVIATEVEDFQLTPTPESRQAVTLSVSFKSRFQALKSAQESTRAGTTAFTTVMLRNKRPSTPTPVTP